MFEKWNMDFFSEIPWVQLGGAFATAVIDKRNVHDVVPVGGSTRIPVVQKMIQ